MTFTETGTEHFKEYLVKTQKMVALTVVIFLVLLGVGFLVGSARQTNEPSVAEARSIHPFELEGLALESVEQKVKGSFPIPFPPHEELISAGLVMGGTPYRLMRRTTLDADTNQSTLVALIQDPYGDIIMTTRRAVLNLDPGTYFVFVSDQESGRMTDEISIIDDGWINSTLSRYYKGMGEIGP